ncbi:hypothetical protein ACIA59_24820, partial [Micromonospora haikouensis]
MSTDTIEATDTTENTPPTTDPDPNHGSDAGNDGLPLADADAPDAEPTADDLGGDPPDGDSPTGFPGGALLLSAADVLAVGGGAVWAGVTGFGALLLAAAATAAAGLAMADRKAKRNRERRDSAGRTGQSARPSRRAAAAGGAAGGRGRNKPGSGKATPGGLFGKSKAPAGGGLFGRKPGGGKGSPGGGGKNADKRRGRKPGKDGTGTPGGGLFGRKPGGGKGSPGGGGGKNKNADKRKGPRKPHGLGLRLPRTGSTPRGRNGRKPSPKPVAGPEDAARLAEEARKANDATNPTTDKPTADKPAGGNDAAGTTTNGTDLAGLVGSLEITAGGGVAMGNFPLPGAASEFRSAASRYTPDDMYEFGAHLAQMPAAMLDIAEGLKAMALRTHAERPVDPRV